MNDLTILYVEDDDMVRDSFTQILQHYFGHVLTANNGADALKMYENSNPDIALLDISLPKINGLEVAKQIREKNESIEIIMLTAYADQEKLLQAVNLQLFAYLLKPIKKEELDSVLSKLVEKLSAKSRVALGFDYSWDKQKQELFLSNEQLKLTKNEKYLIELLLRYPGRYYKACEIAHQILDHYDEEGDDVQCNNIVQLISRFKKRLIALHKDNHFFIQNTYGSGYKLSL